MGPMTPSLPDGYSLRPAGPDDSDAILAVGIARDIADVGHPDWSLEDVREEMADADAVFVVEDEAGAVVAFAFLDGEDGRVNVHPEATNRGIGRFLREHLEALAHGAGARELRQAIFGADDAARALCHAAAYETAQHFWRMARELDGSEPEPQWP